MAQSCRWHICHLATWLLQPFVHHLNSLRPSIKFTMEVEKDGTLPFRMCLWLTSTKSHHTDHSVASYGKCTENQYVQTDVSTIDLTTSLPPRIESWSITYKPKWCNRSYVIYCIPCQDGNHLYVGETCRTLKTRALYIYVIYCNLSLQRIVWIHHLYQAFSQPLWALNIPVKHSLMLSCSSSQIIIIVVVHPPGLVIFFTVLGPLAGCPSFDWTAEYGQ